MQLAKALIRLHIWAVCSEPLLVTHTTLLEISCPELYYGKCLNHMSTNVFYGEPASRFEFETETHSMGNQKDALNETPKTHVKTDR